MHGRFVGWPLEEAFFFKLGHQTHIRQIFRAFSLESGFRAEFFNTQRDILELRVRTLGNRALDIRALHELEQTRIVDF